MAEVIDLVDSSPEALPIRRAAAKRESAKSQASLEAVASWENEPLFSDEEEEPSQPYRKRVSESVLDLTGGSESGNRSVDEDADDDASFGREVCQDLYFEDKDERPTKRRLSPGNKARSVAKRTAERAKKRAEKQASKAAELTAYTEPRRVELALGCTKPLEADFGALVELLQRRGFEFVEERTEILHRLASWPTLEWFSRQGQARWSSTGYCVVVFDLMAKRLPPAFLESLRAVVAILEGLPDPSRPTVALLGPERERLFSTITWLEDTLFACRCVVPPKHGRDPGAKATAKLAELVQAHTNTIVTIVKDPSLSRPHATSAKPAGLLSGLEPKDLCHWRGAKPRTSKDAWPTLLRSILPANAAEAVAAAYPSYIQLHTALKSRQIDAVQHIATRTASGKNIGPALATRLLTFFTEYNPDAQPQSQFRCGTLSS